MIPAATRGGDGRASRLLGRLPVPAGVHQRRELYRLLNSFPENQDVTRVDAVTPTLAKLPRTLPLVRSVAQRRLAAAFEDDLRRLNDALGPTPLAGRYWVWSGLLLGWAREGRILPWDADADFGFAAEDEERYAAAVPALLDAGFRRWFRFRNNDGVITEETFVRRGRKFEFYRMSDVGDQREYHMYGRDSGGLVQLVARLPRQQLVPFEFIGRSWMKPLHHTTELEAIYGDWRTPDPGFDYLEERTIVARHRWAPGPAAARPLDPPAGAGRNGDDG